MTQSVTALNKCFRLQGGGVTVLKYFMPDIKHTRAGEAPKSRVSGPVFGQKPDPGL